MTTMYLCPHLEYRMAHTVERVKNMPAAEAVAVLDEMIDSTADFINRVIDSHWEGSDCQQDKVDTTNALLDRWDNARRHVRDVRFAAWMEKWFPRAVWDFGNDN